MLKCPVSRSSTALCLSDNMLFFNIAYGILKILIYSSVGCTSVVLKGANARKSIPNLIFELNRRGCKGLKALHFVIEKLQWCLCNGRNLRHFPQVAFRGGQKGGAAVCVFCVVSTAWHVQAPVGCYQPFNIRTHMS